MTRLWPLLFLLVFLPLPFASARPIFQWGWIIYLALWAIAVSLTALWREPARLERAIGLQPTFFLVPFWLVVVWMVVQTLPLSSGLAFQIGLPVVDARLAANQTISVAPALTLKVAAMAASHGLLLFLVIYTIRTKQEIHHILKALSIIGALYAGYGFAIYVTGNKTVLWFEKWGYFNSLTSTFVNRNNFADYMGLVLIATLAVGVQSWRKNATSGKVASINLFAEWVLRHWWIGAALLIVSTALLLTGSRAGNVSAAAGAVTFLAISAMGTQSSRHGMPGKKYLAFAGIFAVFLLLVSFSGTYLGDRMEKDLLDDERFELYPVMLGAIMERPLLGYGAGSFEDMIRLLRPENIQTFYLRGHSDYLEMVMTLGLPAALFGLIAFGAIAVRLLSQCLKNAGDHTGAAVALAAMVLLGTHAIIDFPFQIPAISYVLVVLVGLGLAEPTAKRSRS